MLRTKEAQRTDKVTIQSGFSKICDQALFILLFAIYMYIVRRMIVVSQLQKLKVY